MSRSKKLTQRQRSVRPARRKWVDPALRRLTLATTISLCITVTGHAAVLTWDGSNTETSGAQGGDGTWDVNSTTNWWDGSDNVKWPALGGTNDDAVFGTNAGTVSIAAGGVTANDLTFNVDGYMLTGGTLTLNGTTPKITTATGTTTIISAIAGSDGFTKAGAGTLILTADNSYTGATTINGGTLTLKTLNLNTYRGGQIDINNGSTLQIEGAGGVNRYDFGTVTYNFDAIGGGKISTVGGSTNWVAQGNWTFKTNGGAKNTIDGEAGMNMNGSDRSVVFDVARGSDSTSDLTVAINLHNTNGSLTKGGNGILTLTGSNSYTGGTTINAGKLVLGYGGGSGAIRGVVTVNSGGTLEATAGDAFGYFNDAQISTLILNGGSFNNATGSNQGYRTNVNLSGGTMTSNGGGRFHFTTGYGITSNASSISSTISSGIEIRDNSNMLIAVADGAAAVDLSITGSMIGGGGSITKSGAGTMSLSAQNTYTGGTTVNEGILDLTGGGGGSGTIRGTVTVNSGGTLRLSTGDATGYNTDSTRLSLINLNGGTLDINTTWNQTLGNATINMTGASITGVAGSNLDFFQGTSALNSLASATTSTVSGVRLKMRQNNGLTINVAQGTTPSGIDLDISSVIANDTGFTNNILTKDGAGTLRLSGTNTYSTETIISAGTLLVSGSIGSSDVTISSGAVLASGSTGTIGKTVTIHNGAILAPGGQGGTGTATVTNGTTFNDKSIFSWDLNATGSGTVNPGSYDKLVAGSVSGAGAIFRIVLGGSDTFADPFWQSSHSWDNIFTGATDLAVIFSSFEFRDSQGNTGPTAGSFAFTGNTLNYNFSAVPETSTAFAGLLLGAGLLRRRRARVKDRTVATPGAPRFSC